MLGREEGQLWYPRKVAVIRTSGKYVVCDRGSERSRMQIFTKNGQFIKKIAIRYIDIVAGLAITTQGQCTVYCVACVDVRGRHQLLVALLVYAHTTVYRPFVWDYPDEGLLGSRVVIVLDSGAKGPEFKLQSRRCRVTVLGKLFTPIVPLFTKQQNW